MSDNSSAPLAPPVPPVNQPAPAAADVLKDDNGQPLTKSALKRIEKEKALAAKKALKQQNKPQVAKAADGAAAAQKAVKKDKPKKDDAPEEPPYVDVPAGHKKGQSQTRLPLSFRLVEERRTGEHPRARRPVASATPGPPRPDPDR